MALRSLGKYVEIFFLSPLVFERLHTTTTPIAIIVATIIIFTIVTVVYLTLFLLLLLSSINSESIVVQITITILSFD